MFQLFSDATPSTNCNKQYLNETKELPLALVHVVQFHEVTSYGRKYFCFVSQDFEGGECGLKWCCPSPLLCYFILL